MGHPWQIIVGPRGAAAGKVELKRRATGERSELSPEEALTASVATAKARAQRLGPRFRGMTCTMFGPFERAVAGRYLRARKGERFVSIIAVFSLVGIALGVATLIVVTSVMSGFQTELESRVLGVNGHITIEAFAGDAIDNYQPLLDGIRAIPGIVGALPVLDGQALLTTDRGGARGGLVRGVTLDDLRSLHPVSDHILAGKLDEFAGDDAIVVGVRSGASSIAWASATR